MIAFKTLQINMAQNSKGKTSDSYIMMMIILKISPLIISQILPALLVLIIRILIHSLKIKPLNRLLKLLNRLRCLRHRFTTAIKMSQWHFCLLSITMILLESTISRHPDMKATITKGRYIPNHIRRFRIRRVPPLKRLALSVILRNSGENWTPSLLVPRKYKQRLMVGAPN